jgi:hypothetical protein
MAKCSSCGAETILYENDVPICVNCADRADGQDAAGRQKEIPAHRPIHLRQPGIPRKPQDA